MSKYHPASVGVNDLVVGSCVGKPPPIEITFFSSTGISVFDGTDSEARGRVKM